MMITLTSSEVLTSEGQTLKLNSTPFSVESIEALKAQAKELAAAVNGGTLESITPKGRWINFAFSSGIQVVYYLY